jgi:hypothetical protein
MEPILIFQFFSGNFLRHIQKLLRDEAFQFAETLPLEDGPDRKARESYLHKQRNWSGGTLEAALAAEAKVRQ